MVENCKDNKNNNAIKVIAPLMIAIILAIFGWVFIQINSTNARVDDTNAQLDADRTESLKMQGDIKAIKVNVEWIKEAISNGK